MSVDEPTSMAVPHEEQCDKALEHYLKISNEAAHFSSLVPDAIEFYKERYVRRGERKIFHALGLTGKACDDLTAALKDGWFFDPWLNSRGRPITSGTEGELGIYWVLVKGTPEQVAALEPFVELPEEEIDDGPEDVMEPYGLRTIFIAYNALDGEGNPVKPPDGFVVMHKDHIFAKGTVYTLPPGESSTPQ